MRLWSIHPKYLDSKGLVAVWREGLLALKVLWGKTKGYKNHTQLIRFKNSKNPLNLLVNYLSYILLEADKRGFNFNASKLPRKKSFKTITIKKGQIIFEFEYLKKKLKIRDPKKYESIKDVKKIMTNPVFKVVKGSCEEWEKGGSVKDKKRILN